MKVGFVQLDVSRCWKQNLLQIRRALEEDCPELVVLPELCDGGYLYPDRPTLLETAQPLTESPFVQGIQAMSWEFGCTMVFGTTERDQDRVYNTAAVTSHGALMGRYRKMHLSRLEQTLFDPGDSPVVVEAAGVKLGLGICFDLWFPEFTRNCGGRERSFSVFRRTSAEKPLLGSHRCGLWKTLRRCCSAIGLERNSLRG